MSGLYLRAGERNEGPFDPDEVRRRLSGGELPSHTMSWRPGERGWKSLAKRWPHGSLQNRLAWLVALLGLLMAFALDAALMTVPGRLFVHLPDSLQTKVFLHLFVSIGVVVSVALTAALVATRWMRAHRIPLPHALCVMLTLMATATSIALCKQTGALVDAEDRFPNALINYDESAHAIHISGMIGHRFSSDLADTLMHHGDARMVVINSTGGLLRESFRAADMLVKAHLPLRVDGICASACGLMWATVPDREMTLLSRIGLHQNRMIVDLPAELAAAVNQDLETKSTYALSSAGFTPDMLRYRAETPPNRMYWLTSADIMVAGIRARVLDAHEQPVSLSKAKWAMLTGAWGKNSLSAEIYQAIAEREPSLADVYGPRLYDAFHANNMTLFHSIDRALEAQALQQAFREAPDQAVMAWAQSRQYDMAAASQNGNVAECGLLTSTKDAELADAATRKRLNERGLSRNLALLNAMPPATAGSMAFIDIHSAAASFSTYSSRIVGQLRQQGYPADTSHWSSLQHCGYSNALLQGAEQMPLASGAMMVRYGEVGRYVH
jgi:hypothetical protein